VYWVFHFDICFLLHADDMRVYNYSLVICCREIRWQWRITVYIPVSCNNHNWRSIRHIFSDTTFIITATLETSDFLCLLSEGTGDLQRDFVSLAEISHCFKGTNFHCKFGKHSLKHAASRPKSLNPDIHLRFHNMFLNKKKAVDGYQNVYFFFDTSHPVVCCNNI
jgi:hypothetical protein